MSVTSPVAVGAEAVEASKEQETALQARVDALVAWSAAPEQVVVWTDGEIEQQLANIIDKDEADQADALALALGNRGEFSPNDLVHVSGDFFIPHGLVCFLQPVPEHILPVDDSDNLVPIANAVAVDPRSLGPAAKPQPKATGKAKAKAKGVMGMPGVGPTFEGRVYSQNLRLVQRFSQADMLQFLNDKSMFKNAEPMIDALASYIRAELKAGRTVSIPRLGGFQRSTDGGVNAVAFMATPSTRAHIFDP
jgi:hypothetical protein